MNFKYLYLMCEICKEKICWHSPVSELTDFTNIHRIMHAHDFLKEPEEHPDGSIKGYGHEIVDDETREYLPLNEKNKKQKRKNKK